MTCNKNNRKEVVIAVLYMIIIISMGFLAYKLLNRNNGTPCAIEVQFKDSKATYIGTSV